MDFINSPLINGIVVLFIVGSSLYLGLLVYLQDRTATMNKLFAVFSISTAYWILLAFLPDIPAYRPIALISAKLNYIALIGVAYTLFTFPFYFPRRRGLNKYVKYGVAVIGGVLGFVTLFTDLILKKLEFYDWGASYVDGNFAFIFQLFMFAATFNAIGQYIYIWKRLDEKEKKEADLFVIGLSIFLISNIVIQSIIKPIVGTDEFYRIGNYSSIFMVLLTSFAIVKRGLFDVKVITTEIITILIWIVLIVKLLINNSPTSAIIDGSVLLVMIIFGILLIRSVIKEVKQKEELEVLTEKYLKANKKLKELDTLKDEFVSIASHELRTPMTAVKSYLWMALNQPEQTIKPTLKKYLDISYASTERLIHLVNDMLTVSRIERNKVEIKSEPVDIFEVLQAVYNELKVTADQNKIHFTLKRSDEKPFTVTGDKEKLREVFQNIVGNALKFTPQDGSIKVDIRRKDGNITAAISDTGPGIPEESMHILFQKFGKIEYSYSKHSNQPGTGLGLYISKQIISLHKGEIQVESKVDVGTTFTVLLPAKTKEK
jgi:signal transduction histidine kinase